MDVRTIAEVVMGLNLRAYVRLHDRPVQTGENVIE